MVLIVPRQKQYALFSYFYTYWYRPTYKYIHTVYTDKERQQVHIFTSITCFWHWRPCLAEEEKLLNSVIIYRFLCTFTLKVSIALQNAGGDGDEDNNDRFDGINAAGYDNIVLKYT